MLRLGGVLSLLLAFSSSCNSSHPSTLAHKPAPPLPPIDYHSDQKNTSQAQKQPVKKVITADSVKYHFIDVGQGDATLIEFPCGAMLIDTGGEHNAQFRSDEVLLSYLDQFFDRRADLNNTLDLLVITHPHIDHIRSALKVLERYRVNNVVDNGMEDPEDPGGEQQIAMHQWLATSAKKVAHLDVSVQEIDSLHGLTNTVIDPIASCQQSSIDPQITVLWGSVRENLESFGLNPNNHSVAVRVDFGASSSLFTGDLETLGLSRLFSKYRGNPSIFDVDIYQVGHHGSKNATTHYLMEAMSPKIAIISMGPYERNEEWTARRYGHPHELTLHHLLHSSYGVSDLRPFPIDVQVGLRGAWKDEKKELFRNQHIRKAVYATGWDGTIIVTADASGYFEVEARRIGEIHSP